jgi:hypothetical protein
VQINSSPHPEIERENTEIPASLLRKCWLWKNSAMCAKTQRMYHIVKLTHKEEAIFPFWVRLLFSLKPIVPAVTLKPHSIH